MTEQEAFENYIHLAPYDFHKVWEAACAWQREALAQPEQEPVAECKDDGEGGVYYVTLVNDAPTGKLYSNPTPIPEGWQLVPKEPIIKMSDAFFSAYIEYPEDFGSGQSQSVEDFHDFRYMYAAMLAAAPKLDAPVGSKEKS